MPEARRYGSHEPPPGVMKGRPLGVQILGLPTPTCNNEGNIARNGQPNLGQVVGVSDDPKRDISAKMLPTPQANIATNGGSQSPAKRRAGGHSVSIQDVAEHDLLPTPQTMDEFPWNPDDADDRAAQGKQLMLIHVVGGKLLPTPAVNDMGEGKTPEEFDEWNDGPTMAHQPHSSPLSIEAQRLVHDESRCVECGCPEDLHDEGGFCAGRCGGEMCGGRQYEARLLPTPKATNNENEPSEGYAGGVGWVTQHTDWGQYAPAVERWSAIIGRPAPTPTVPEGKGGAPRLNPQLTEWMMGLPEGWVCDVPGLSRNAKLKACGNGVVPMQAAAALILMVTDEGGFDVAA